MQGLEHRKISTTPCSTPAESTHHYFNHGPPEKFAEVDASPARLLPVAPPTQLWLRKEAPPMPENSTEKERNFPLPARPATASTSHQDSRSATLSQSEALEAVVGRCHHRHRLPLGFQTRADDHCLPCGFEGDWNRPRGGFRVPRMRQLRPDPAHTTDDQTHACKTYLDSIRCSASRWFF